MPIDPAGTKPGLSPTTEPPVPTLHMKCKRPECDSNIAIEVKIPTSASGRRLYQCVKCKVSWGINTGGPVDL